MTQKISVIGGSGFVGTNLCRYLANRQQDFEIIDIKRSNQFPDKFKFGDVRDLESIRAAITGEIVVNLAAVHRDDERDETAYYRTNVAGAENIALACKEKAVNKIIFTSSVAVYGFSEPGTGEAGKIDPFNEYGRTKHEAELKFHSWSEETGGSLIIVRPTVIFGEGNRGNVYNLFNQIASGRFFMVGDGNNTKSMAYIENIVAFLDTCIKTDETKGVFNYVDTPDLTMNELVSQVKGTLHGNQRVGIRLPRWLGLIIGYFADGISFVSKRRLPVSSIRVKKFTSFSQFSSQKAQLDGFSPPVSLRDGISRTLKSEFISPDPDREVFFTE